MHSTLRFLAACSLAACCSLAAPAFATDVDGIADCSNVTFDFGDAPEGVQAYPGVLAAFPTCIAAGPVGTQNIVYAPISTAPGPAGYVRHLHAAGLPAHWLGCFPGQGGYDGEDDGKTNDTGAPTSACGPNVGVDCVEAAFGLSFGQDECYGSSDATLASPVTFVACGTTTVTINLTNCDTERHDIYVNVLVDWNQDGDWNDNFDCAGVAVFEWAVKNWLRSVPPGCPAITLPAIQAGPLGGSGWMRITISDEPMSDDFPWAGTDAAGFNTLRNGETEDYPVTILGGGGGLCPDYEDWGDAPEEAVAYGSGTIGRFPTCAAATLPGNQSSVCPPISTVPGSTGYVRHVANQGDPKFWFGCGDATMGTNGIDSEQDGKMNDTGGPVSLCNPVVGIDGLETAFGMNFGQDENVGDAPFDAGVRSPVTLTACTSATVDYFLYVCDPGELGEMYLNVLVDWNQDGDWNDNFDCAGACAYEWAVKNVPVGGPLGCSLQSTPAFLVGPNAGQGWMRLTLSSTPVGDDFPWNGSLTPVGPDYIIGGETEDYPVTIVGPDTCDISYSDFGDAPEDVRAYSTGVLGRFPTCIAAGPLGDQQLECGVPVSTPPGATGYVLHQSFMGSPDHFWLGVGTGGYSPLVAIDSEIDGKMNLGAPLGGASYCDPAQLTDCLDFFTGLGINQDECYGDPDAGVTTPTFFYACSTATVTFDAYNCGTSPVNVALNLLVDWNHDGDWNDVSSVLCSEQICAYEWPVKNIVFPLMPGTNTVTTPTFATGPTPGRAWMRLTLSSNTAPDDFPWNGSAGVPGATMLNGETEDYVANVVSSPTAVDDDARVTKIWLAAPIPNPARNEMSLQYALPRAAEVSLAIYDLAGRRLAVVESGTKEAGVHNSHWNLRDAAGHDVPAGHYIIKLRVGDTVATRRAIRVR